MSSKGEPVREYVVLRDPNDESGLPFGTQEAAIAYAYLMGDAMVIERTTVIRVVWAKPGVEPQEQSW